MVYHQIQLCLWEDSHQFWQSLHSVFSVSENNQIMLQKIAFLEDVVPFESLLEWLKCLLCILSSVKLVIVTSFEVCGIYTLRMVCQVLLLEDLETHIVVLHLVVAQGHIYVDGVELSTLQQKLLVNLSGLFIVPSQIMQSRQTKLILGRLLDLGMVSHQILLVVFLVGNVEEESNLQRSLWAFKCFSL